MSEPTRAAGPAVVIVSRRGEDAVAHQPPVDFAVERLTTALQSAGVAVRTAASDGPDDAVQIVVAGSSGASGEPTTGESFTMSRPTGRSGPVVVTGADARGLGYGVLELAERVAHAGDPVAELAGTEPLSESPATPVRSILRVFVSIEEDTPWFHDREFWSDYLTELATDRVNRFQLGFGMQYNYGHHPATDNYLCFAYPFLLDVPGYDVSAKNVSTQERERNLETLRFISDETKRRGIDFQLGLWNHAYDQGPGSEPTHPIVGLTPESHAPYCAAALAQLLEECPAIDGLTVRVHYEGGVPEPGHDFWRTVMAGAASVERRVEIDMHAKGVDEGLLDVARETGQPVVVSAKHWAEHQGLPYQQTTIRDKERATADPGTGLMSITAHQRRFTRYGYGDFLKEDRDFDLLFRIWPGTQRLLLWGDPVLAAGYGRLGTIGGALGIELCEPLFFKGRKGTGSVGGRDPYDDPELRLGGQDWRKYRYTYRLWGRLLYNPDADPEVWRRLLRTEYGAAALPVESALASASRVLPLITVVHALGASNNGYWPEMYTDMPIVEGPHTEYFRKDTAAPPTFNGVSAFDPSMFYRVDDYADDMVAGRRDGRYGPDELADWFDTLAFDAERDLAAAREATTDPKDPVFRRLDVDVTAQAGLGHFFAGKYRAGLAYALYVRTQETHHLREALNAYRDARAAWVGIIAATDHVYRDDLTFGHLLTEHGHWKDRLPAIDTDLAAMERVLQEAPATPAATKIHPAPRGERPALHHTPPEPFERGAAVPITATDERIDGDVVLHYRHLNQGEDYEQVVMTRSGDRFEATIPAGYSGSPYPLAYYFVVRAASGDAWIVPGLDRTLANQPYHVVRQVNTRPATR